MRRSLFLPELFSPSGSCLKRRHSAASLRSFDMGVLPIGLAPEGGSAAIAAQRPRPVVTIRRYAIRPMAWVLLVAIAALIPGYAPDFTGSASIILVFVLLGTGLSLEIGLAAVPDFAVAGYFAAGAYCAAALSGQTAWPFWAYLPLCGLVGTVFAFAVAKPLVRKSAPVFAIVTLAFSTIVQTVLTNWNVVTGGATGSRLAPITDRALYYY